MTYVILEVSKETHDDIRQRIEVHGPIYTRDFLTTHRQYGPLIVFGEVALAVERKPRPVARGERALVLIGSQWQIAERVPAADYGLPLNGNPDVWSEPGSTAFLCYVGEEKEFRHLPPIS